MESQQRDMNADVIPLHLEKGVREKAERISHREGVSLDEFVAAAVAEKLDRLEHFNWARNRKSPTPERLAAALELLRRPSGNAPDPGDELPPGWSSLTS